MGLPLFAPDLKKNVYMWNVWPFLRCLWTIIYLLCLYSNVIGLPSVHRCAQAIFVRGGGISLQAFFLLYSSLLKMNKQGQTVHMLQLFLDIYSISPPIYIYIYINTYIHIYKYIYNIHIYLWNIMKWTPRNLFTLFWYPTPHM